LVEQRKREKIEDKKARQRVKDMIEQDRKDREAKRVSASTSVSQVVSKVQEPKIDNKSDEARLQVN